MSNAYRAQLEADALREAAALSQMGRLRREHRTTLELHEIAKPRLDKRAARSMARGLRGGNRIWTRGVAIRTAEEQNGMSCY